MIQTKSKPSSDSGFVYEHILSTETVTIPVRRQMNVLGTLILEGTLILNGTLGMFS